MKKTPKTLYVADRDAWRAWLEENHARETEVWLVYYKKHAGRPRIPYDNAVRLLSEGKRLGEKWFGPSQ